MENQQAIADIIDRKPAEPVSAPEAKPGEDNGISRDDKGRFAGKAERPEVTPEPAGEKPTVAPPPVAAPSQPPEGYVPIAALVDTRFEARQAKHERDELRRQIAELQKPKTEPVDFFSDPEGALNQRLQPFQQQFQQTVSSLTLRASKAEAVAVHGKQAVDEMDKALGEAMQAGDPEVHHLRAQMMNSDDPAGVAMDWFQRRRVLSEVGTDPQAYREKLRAEIRAEMQAELNGGSPAPQPAPVMPSNLAGARNVGTRAGPAWSGPTPLTDIFARK